MRKSEPRKNFANETEERKHTLDYLCGMHAKRVSLDLGMALEDCADSVKHLVLSDHFVIDFDAKGGRVRLMPTTSEATPGEIIMACMFVIAHTIGSIDCHDCRKVAARTIGKALPCLMQAAMAQATGQPASQHRH
jgi:hypothetical protein